MHSEVARAVEKNWSRGGDEEEQEEEEEDDNKEGWKRRRRTDKKKRMEKVCSCGHQAYMCICILHGHDQIKRNGMSELVSSSLFLLWRSISKDIYIYIYVYIRRPPGGHESCGIVLLVMVCVCSFKKGIYSNIPYIFV